MIDGLVVVDKPSGATSHDVVARIRRMFGQKRVGHSGTLDPGATGVLLVGLGRATRLLGFLSDLAKEYSGELVLGTATSTLDSFGEVVGRWDMAGVGLEDVRSAAAGFVGEILQVPPMVSAVRVGGRRLHELARAGLEVERQPRSVVVHRLDVETSETPGVFGLSVRCSSGTYVRSLAADIGAALGGGAHLGSLRRSAIGSFTLAEARPLESLGEADVLPPVEAMRDYRRLAVDEEVAAAVGHGKVLDLDVLGLGAGDDTAGMGGGAGGPGAHDNGPGAGPWAVVGPDGALLAVYQPYRPGQAKPAMVMAAPG